MGNKEKNISAKKKIYRQREDMTGGGNVGKTGSKARRGICNVCWVEEEA